MVTHDFSIPIPPGTLRISVLADNELFAADYPTAKLSVTLSAFGEHANIDQSGPGPQASQRCKEKAAAAVEDGDSYLITAAALWLFLKQPGAQYEMHAERLTAMIRENGACMLTVTVNRRTGGVWDFRLFAMPRWPAASRPTNPDVQRGRRWR